MGINVTFQNFEQSAFAISIEQREKTLSGKISQEWCLLLFVSVYNTNFYNFLFEKLSKVSVSSSVQS